jgi:hypothetical protein
MLKCRQTKPHQTVTSAFLSLVVLGGVMISHQAQAAPPKTQSSPLDEFIRTYEQPPEEGGGRSGAFCSIAPLTSKAKSRSNNFLSDRPTFVWEGEATRIEVRPIGEDNAIWGKDLQPQDRMAIYPADEPALLPNKTYKLWFKLASGTTYDDITFSVLSASQRQSVQSGLTQAVSQLPASQKSNKSAIAAKQAIYLGQQALWLDAFGALFSLSQQDVPIQERANWNRGIDTIRRSLCKPPQ